jgi:hypothetical protein
METAGCSLLLQEIIELAPGFFHDLGAAPLEVEARQGLARQDHVQRLERGWRPAFLDPAADHGLELAVDLEADPLAVQDPAHLQRRAGTEERVEHGLARVRKRGYQQVNELLREGGDVVVHRLDIWRTVRGDAENVPDATTFGVVFVLSWILIQVLLFHAYLVKNIIVIKILREHEDVFILGIEKPGDVMVRLRQGVGNVPDEVVDQLPAGDRADDVHRDWIERLLEPPVADVYREDRVGLAHPVAFLPYGIKTLQVILIRLLANLVVVGIVLQVPVRWRGHHEINDSVLHVGHGFRAREKNVLALIGHFFTWNFESPSYKHHHSLS